jgi:hypothetical protein
MVRVSGELYFHHAWVTTYFSDWSTFTIGVSWSNVTCILPYESSPFLLIYFFFFFPSAVVCILVVQSPGVDSMIVSP